MARRAARRGLTRIEVVVLLAGVTLVATLAWPRLFIHRHPTGRNQCSRNLSTISIALQSYHDVFRVLPMGAMHAGDLQRPRIGPSWWYAILPFIEQGELYEMIADTQTPGFVPAAIEFTYGGMPDRKASPIQSRLRTFAPAVLRCPVTPLPLMEQHDGHILMPSYVGIAGGCDIDPDSTDYDGCPESPRSQQRYLHQVNLPARHGRSKATGPNGSIITFSGMLPLMQHVRGDSCSDGMSNTMIVAEQSDWLRSADGDQLGKYHGDPGWNVQTDRNPGGWLTGTNATVAPSHAQDTEGPEQSGEPSDWQLELLFNITTVRYRPDFKRVMRSPPNASLPGCGEVMGHNNPLQSPHPGGLLVVFVDGSVQFISGTMDLAVLLRLAIRNDGQKVEIDP